jgi:hypothetical protein
MGPAKGALEFFFPMTSPGLLMSCNTSVLGHLVIGITVQPLLPGFGGRDHRVARCAGVLRGVAVGRRVAAERHPAGLARAKVHPSRACLHALFTLPAFGQPERRDLVDVLTHRASLRFTGSPSTVPGRLVPGNAAPATRNLSPSIRDTSPGSLPVSSQRSSGAGISPAAVNSSMNCFIRNFSSSWPRERSASSKYRHRLRSLIQSPPRGRSASQPLQARCEHRAANPI